MKSAIYMNGNRFVESEFQYEKELEKIVLENSKILFGEKAIFFDVKSKLWTSSLNYQVISFVFQYAIREHKCSF